MNVIVENKEGLRLSEFRKQVRMTQSEFSEKIGCSQPNLNKIEKGLTGISSSMRTKIFEAFPELNPSWFQAGMGKMVMQEAHIKSVSDTDNPDVILSRSEIFIDQINQVAELFEQGKIPLPAMKMIIHNMKKIIEIQNKRIIELQDDKDLLKALIVTSKDSPFKS